MQSIKSQLKLFLRVCAVGFLATGCCSTRCVDCIPLSKMPYTIYNGGNKYLLVDHLSINQKIGDNELLYNNPVIFNVEKKFPNDKELLAYLDRLNNYYKKVYGAYDDKLDGIKTDLKQSGGELYYYRMLDKKGNEVEEGWLILSKGKVFKKYITGTVP